MAVTRITDKEQEWRNKFAEKLKEAMKEKGVTQLALAYDLNTNTSLISAYVLAKMTPSSYMLYKIAKCLNVPPNRLCGWYDEA